jgi:hypothetical protein
MPYELSLLGFSEDGRSLITLNANGSGFVLTVPSARP